jgi:hypothetical protein
MINRTCPHNARFCARIVLVWPCGSEDMSAPAPTWRANVCASVTDKVVSDLARHAPSSRGMALTGMAGSGTTALRCAWVVGQGKGARDDGAGR